jgi:hypothetical protein
MEWQRDVVAIRSLSDIRSTAKGMTSWRVLVKPGFYQQLDLPR